MADETFWSEDDAQWITSSDSPEKTEEAIMKRSLFCIPDRGSKR
jgi:hypothetical protein